MCRREVVMAATAIDDESIVGDECHMVARSSDGPRGDPLISENEVDDYPNLILLCKVHHKLIDDQPSTYTLEYLKTLKRSHEKWLQDTLLRAAAGKKQPDAVLLVRIMTGSEALSVVVGADAYDFGNDEPKDVTEQVIIGDFLQALQDYGEVGEDLTMSDKVRVGFELTQEINKLDASGFVVFGASQPRAFKAGNGSLELSVAMIRVIRKDNPIIRKVAERFE